MAIHDRITVTEIPFVFIVHKDSTCKIVILLIGSVKISFIVFAMHNGIIDIRHCFHINPSHYIIIYTFKRCKVNIHRRFQLTAGFRSCRFSIRISFCYRHLCDRIVLIRTFLIFCINMKQIISCITEYTDCCDQNNRQHNIPCCLLFFRLFF